MLPSFGALVALAPPAAVAGVDARCCRAEGFLANCRKALSTTSLRRPGLEMQSLLLVRLPPTSPRYSGCAANDGLVGGDDPVVGVAAC